MNDMKAQLDSISNTLTALRDLPPDGASSLLLDVLKQPDPTRALIDVGVQVQRQATNLNSQISMLDTMRASFPNTKSSVQFELFLCFPKWYPPLADNIEPAALEPSAFDLENWQIGRKNYILSSSQFSPSTSFPSRDEVKQEDGFLVSSWNIWISEACLRFWTDVPLSIRQAELALNVYLRTDHLLYGFMDTELFLGDMAACRTRYCSTALVNAVLHYACMKMARCDLDTAVLVDDLEAATEKALDDARHLDVTKIAALNVHYTAVVFSRPFEQAVQFLDKATALSDELYGWNEPSPLYAAWCQSPDDEKMMSHVVWSVTSSALYNAHRWGSERIPPLPRLPVPYFEASTRATVSLPSSPAADVEKIACERYIFAAITANLPFVRESVILNFSEKSLSDEDRAAKIGSIYVRSLNNAIAIERPRALHAELIDVAAISQMWAHFWILSVFQPLTHHRGTIPGFQASDSTAGAIFVASARQLQHLVFLYQRHHSLAPSTTAMHGPIFIAAVALTQIRRVSNRALKFEALVWLFADLAISFCGLRRLLQSLVLTGYEAGFINLQKIRFLFNRFSNLCEVGRRDEVIPTADSEKNRLLAAELREQSYDAHFATTYVIDEPEDKGGS